MMSKGHGKAADQPHQPHPRNSEPSDRSWEVINCPASQNQNTQNHLQQRYYLSHGSSHSIIKEQSANLRSQQYLPSAGAETTSLNAHPEDPQDYGDEDSAEPVSACVDEEWSEFSPDLQSNYTSDHPYDDEQQALDQYMSQGLEEPHDEEFSYRAGTQSNYTRYEYQQQARDQYPIQDPQEGPEGQGLPYQTYPPQDSSGAHGYGEPMNRYLGQESGEEPWSAVTYHAE